MLNSGVLQFYLLYDRLRQRMLETLGIIVCNQDLLAVNMMKKSMDRNFLMSNDIGMIVIDESHNLESRVRSSVTSYITVQKLKDSVYGASKAIDIFDEEFTGEVEIADQLIDRAFQVLLKKIEQQDKKAEELLHISTGKGKHWKSKMSMMYRIYFMHCCSYILMI